MMQRCETCKWWIIPARIDYEGRQMCNPLDQDTYEPMERQFEIRMCKMPTQTFHESPIESDGFGLTDASQYFALLVTAENFGCVKHEKRKGD